MQLPDRASAAFWAGSLLGAGALKLLQGDGRRSADAHLVKPVFKGLKGISIYLKDETMHPAGSLKHRLARSLFLDGICNGHIGPGTTPVEASSGSTAVSEAYFAHLLDLPFIAVMPRSTSHQTIEAIERFGGCCHFVDHAGEIHAVAQKLATETDGYYLDQFTNAEHATDWRGNNNIAQSIFEQMQCERRQVPDGLVLDILVQSRRDTQAAKRLLRKLLKKQSMARRVMITDKLANYRPARREIMPGVGHRQHRGLNNRAENSHQPTR
ncbi:pyridoxal-phosphate dependent enzyme [Microvirga sp. VF16]|uniref:pyridoxal-phosphate dependent enzyme n=1 Tax=Microvirga sp. VF16 TaxID=2807101 RepID=UPI00352FF146